MARATGPDTTPPGDQAFPHEMTRLREMADRVPADAEFLAQCDRWMYLRDRRCQLYRRKAKGYMEIVRATGPEMDALHASIAATVPTSTAGRRAKINVALMDLPDAGTMWAVARSALAAAADMAALEPDPRTPEALWDTSQTRSVCDAIGGPTLSSTAPEAELLAACAAYAEAECRSAWKIDPLRG